MSEPPTVQPSDERAALLFEQKAFGWIAGIASGLILLGTGVVGSLLWTTNSSVVALTTSVRNLETSVSDLRAQVATATSRQYSSESAALDKATLIGLINTNAANAVSLVTACTVRLNDQEKTINAIQVKLAELSARNGQASPGK